MFLQVTSNSKPHISRKRGRPPGSKSSSRGGTPSPVVHNYSLRQRNPNQTFNGFGNRNPILDEESPDTFGKVVASLARQAKVFTFFYYESIILHAYLVKIGVIQGLGYQT